MPMVSPAEIRAAEGIPLLGNAVRIHARDWAQAVASGLLGLQDNRLFEARVFDRVVRSIVEHRQALLRASSRTPTVLQTGGLQERYPLATTLGQFKASPFVPVTVVLLSLALDLELRQPGNSDVAAITSVVRGLWLQTKSTAFADEIANVSDLHSVVGVLESLLAAGKSRLHARFFAMWDDRLRAEAVSLLRGAMTGPSVPEIAFGPGALESPELPVAGLDLDDDAAEFVVVPEIGRKDVLTKLRQLPRGADLPPSKSTDDPARNYAFEFSTDGMLRDRNAFGGFGESTGDVLLKDVVAPSRVQADFVA